MRKIWTAALSLLCAAAVFAPGQSRADRPAGRSRSPEPAAETRTVAEAFADLAAAAPVNISSSLRSENSDPHVTAVNGRAFVVWTREGGGRELFFNTNESGSWRTPFSASMSQRLAPHGPWTCAVADRSGRTHFVFAGSSTTGNYEIYYNSYQGGALSGVENASQTDGGYSWGGSNYPSVDVAPDGYRYAVWYDDKYEADVWQLFLRYREPSGPKWGPETILDISPNVYQPEIRFDAGGLGHLVFIRRGYGSSVVYYMTGSNPRSRSGWSRYAAISGETQVDFCEPAMEVDDAGNAYVVWEQENGGNAEIYFRKKAGGQWAGTENVSQTGGESRLPDVAVDKKTGAVGVAWLERTGGVWQVFARYFFQGRWSSAQAVATTGLSDGIDHLKYERKPGPSVAIDRTGAVHLVFIAAVNGQNDVFYMGGTGDAPTVILHPPVDVAIESRMDPGSNRKVNTLTWAANPLNEGQEIAAYRVYRKDAGAGDESYSPIATVSAATFAYLDGGLDPQRTFTYNLTSVTAAGQESSGSAAVTDRAVYPDTYPPVNAGLSSVLDASGSRKINILTWLPDPRNAGLDIRTYRVYRKDEQQEDHLMACVAAPGVLTTRYEDGNLPTDRKYVYAIAVMPAWDIESPRTQQLWEERIFPPAEVRVDAAIHDALFFKRKVNLVGWTHNRLNDGLSVSFYCVLRKKAGEADALYRVVAQVRDGSDRYLDRSAAFGETYSYAVTAIDAVGNESRRSAAGTG